MLQASGAEPDGGRSGEADLTSTTLPSRRSIMEDFDAATGASATAFTGTCCTTTGGELDDGTDGGCVKHSHVGKVTDEALQQFDDAMSLVDPGKKENWTRAQARCTPAVLQHECCPCYFILACQFNPWDAAARMCSYWDERIRLFGDRAYEAMTLGSGSVAPTGLEMEDVKNLETGSFVVLPNDRKGRSVVFVDEGRLEPYMLEQANSRLRVHWYVLHACFTSGGDNAHRLVALYACYRPPNSGQYSRARWQYSAGTVRYASVLPIVVDSIHLVTLQTKTGSGKLIQFILSTTATMLGSYLSGLTKVHHGTASYGTFHSPLQEEEQAKSTLLQKLTGEGFTKKALPDWVGGSFGVQDFHSWMKRRRRFEQRAFWTPDQVLEHRRSLNKVHSRQKRRRRHQELSDLQEQVTYLQSANSRARIAHEYLEHLVAAALEVVSLVPEPTVAASHGLVDASGWNSYPNVLSESSEDSYHRSAMAALEPDPIGISLVRSTPHGPCFAAPPGHLAVRGGDPRGALPESRSAGDELMAASVMGRNNALAPHRPGPPPQDSYTTLHSALLHSVSSAGDSSSSYYSTDVLSRPSTGSAMGHRSDDSVPFSLQRAMGSLSGGTEFAHVASFGSDLLDPTDSSHTALLLRSMLRQHQQLLEDMNPSPSGHGRLQGPPAYEAHPDRVAIQRRLLQSVPSAPFPSPASGVAGLPLRDLQAPSSGTRSHNDRRWSGRGAVFEDGRVDASSLFDQDWP